LTQSAAEAHAAPQANLGIIPGGGIEEVAGSGSPGGAFFLGARGDVLLLGSGPGTMAVGPYVDVSTLGFASVNAGAGGEWSLPVGRDFSLLAGAGGFVRAGSRSAGGGGAPPSGAAGLAGSLFFGARSYNFHSWYGLAVGLFAQALWLPESPGSLDAVFGVQVDAEILALPFLLAYEAIAH
jgi:hypothetical protein